MRDRSDNALRFGKPTTIRGLVRPRQRAASKGHVESYFLRANHPTRPLAIWIKATVFAPQTSAAGDSAVAELWCVVMDGERHRHFASKHTVPFALSRFDGGPDSVVNIGLAGATFALGPDGHAEGSADAAGGPCTWSLKWSRPAGGLGEPLSLMPFDQMLEARFPKSKLLTPLPYLRFRGHIDVWGERFDVDDWIGMQGHNWGREHAWEYAWGQCHFLDDQGQVTCSVEGFSGRIRVAGRQTPLLSSLVVRRGDREYRFDRVFDFWRQQARISEPSLSWAVRLKSADGEARLSMRGDAADMVCLGYHNPNGRLSYCLNSKLAAVELRVNPANEPGFSCVSDHGGALEFLRNTPDPRFAEVV